MFRQKAVNSLKSFGKIIHLKIVPKVYLLYDQHYCRCVNNERETLTEFVYFPQDVSETHSSFLSIELQLILRYDILPR